MGGRGLLGGETGTKPGPASSLITGVTKPELLLMIEHHWIKELGYKMLGNCLKAEQPEFFLALLIVASSSWR